ncbi:ATP--guanido phosphotransferase [Clostridium paraputrificum]|uniref:ATP--guanido phosphotransferase n=1 Tax=Clostridium TaxID=1485 RepID=UPI002902FA1B|nr:ATP--guanido phosphotransferase [Clostridium sp.]MBS7132126.1 ATP--guanido phosphotransferase [Clostridium sp.]MDU1034155.1 ATP--guanido phosphotransferase [Clostridium sp.]MDU2285130.1 ATP--guanido phosphotransferase [Clostridium sp.]MDU5741839.1 ATP--guanido phosphotransferase [Clostridium sp.]MDU5786214.1 ATP--guanido phosphotransferase [Clostridium sp.]
MRNWIYSKAQNDDLILCSKLSLARNLEGVLFTDKLEVEDAKKNVDKLSNVIFNKLNDEELKIIKFWDNQIDYIKSYEAKLLVTKELVKRKDRAALIINKEETISIMINEVDHLNIQCTTEGMNLKEVYEVANKIDDLIEEDISYSFHEDFGYLTATPSKVGTGMKASVILHLPALSMSEEITNISKGLSQLGMAINPVYADGNIYEVSNRISLGVTEDEIINNLEGVVENIIQEEIKFRDIVVNKCKDEVEDKIFRAYGILKNAKLMSYKELVELLSYVRLGVEMYVLDLNKDVLNKLLVYTNDEAIQNKLGKSLTNKERKAERAILIQELLK